MTTETKKPTKKSTKAIKAKAEEEKVSAPEESTSSQGEALPTCPSCRAPMVRRSGKFGPFYGCSRFKSGECRATLPVEQ